MRRRHRLSTIAFTSLAFLPSPLLAQAERNNADKALAQLGGQVIRGIDTDICIPASSEEYEALGKHAIMMLRTSSAVSTELPLKSVYAMRNGVRIPLHRIAISPKHHDPALDKTIQFSFYLLPIQFMKSDVRLLADFTGGRQGFGFRSFSKNEGLDQEAPSFARLDEYDTPFDPDMSAVTAVLVREYPDHFH